MTTETTTRPWPTPSAWTLDPPAVLAELRRHAPISRVTLWDGRQAWLVTRYTDARRLLRDPRLSSDATDPNFPSIHPSQVIATDRPGLSRTGEPRHTAIRQAVAGQFTRRAIERWRPFAQRVADEQVAGLLAGEPPADLISQYALPIPVRVIGAILGVPGGDLALVEEYGQRIIASAVDPARQAFYDFRAYLDEMVSRAERTPGDNLLGRVVRTHRRTGVISHDELVDLMMLLVVGGHATTANMIGLGTLSLLREPTLFRAIGENPIVARAAIDEFLRYHTVIADGAPRVAKADVTIAGVQIRAGDAVIVSLASANRDELTFDRSGTIDTDRTGPPHLAFGWGAHRCLGQHLARMELRTAFTTLARAVPTLRLAVPAEQVRFRLDSRLHGLLDLPVTWCPGRS